MCVLQDTCKAMIEMGMSDDDMLNSWRVVACVLHLGNINFTAIEQNGVSGSVVSDDSAAAVKYASQLLRVPPDLLIKDLTHKTTVTKTDKSTSVVSVAKACGECRCHVLTVVLTVVGSVEIAIVRTAASRDALAKSLYHSLFLWLVAQVNDALLPTVRHSCLLHSRILL